ncbi:hypothetical protein F4553_000126 [Allocatelliglobosispora scoriae]|uniref:Tat pathway signal sequence domain protein n=1 Tax=Allocatelliglobosispora scoriae TaxID=643052 RepID=A0A841BCB6_9ACTN|nr:hypothetical protein [Allocatelliglobosispora scoriae]MBB5866747.1 hypothetical protein [Allocatelliglobosispora scoriae]
MLRSARVVAVAALALAGSLVSAAPASASPAQVYCTSPSSNLLTFTPPLTLATQPTVVTRKTVYKPCTSPTVPEIVSGTSSTSFSMPDDCTMVLLPSTVSFTITWNTGRTTTVKASRTATLANPTGTSPTLTVDFAGSVTAGLFTGSLVQQQYVGSGAELAACLNGTGRLPALKSAVSLLIYH